LFRPIEELFESLSFLSVNIFESSLKVTMSPSLYLDRVAKLLISNVMYPEQSLSRYHRSYVLKCWHVPISF